MMTTKKLPQPGQRVGAVSGPGQLPVNNAGTVLTHVTNPYGTSALILMDDGRTEYCEGLTDVGIGWYLLNTKEQ